MLEIFSQISPCSSAMNKSCGKQQQRGPFDRANTKSSHPGVCASLDSPCTITIIFCSHLTLTMLAVALVLFAICSPFLWKQTFEYDGGALGGAFSSHSAGLFFGPLDVYNMGAGDATVSPPLGFTPNSVYKCNEISKWEAQLGHELSEMRKTCTELYVCEAFSVLLLALLVLSVTVPGTDDGPKGDGRRKLFSLGAFSAGIVLLFVYADLSDWQVYQRRANTCVEARGSNETTLSQQCQTPGSSSTVWNWYLAAWALLLATILSLLAAFVAHGSPDELGGIFGASNGTNNNDNGNNKKARKRQAVFDVDEIPAGDFGRRRMLRRDTEFHSCRSSPPAGFSLELKSPPAIEPEEEEDIICASRMPNILSPVNERGAKGGSIALACV